MKESRKLKEYFVWNNHMIKMEAFSKTKTDYGLLELQTGFGYELVRRCKLKVGNCGYQIHGGSPHRTTFSTCGANQ